MNKERELLREIYADLEYDSKLPLWLRDRVRDCLSSTSDDAEELELEEYDAGLLGYFGGGDVEWWQDYIRDLLGRAHDHYQSQVSAHPPKPAESEAEPVVYINLDEKRLEWAVPFEFKSSCFVLGKLPLYLHPPKPAEPEARKPMTEEEIDVGFNPYRMRWLADDQYFVAGVRYAEKHHGIGGDDE